MMRRRIGHKLRAFAPALRGVLPVFLMLADAMVGIAGEVSCAEETLAVAGRVVVDGGQDKADQGDKESVAMVDHCYTCVPLLLPPQGLVAERLAEPVALAFTTPTVLIVSGAGRETVQLTPSGANSLKGDAKNPIGPGTTVTLTIKTAEGKSGQVRYKTR